MTNPPDFIKNDPATPAFWNIRFDANVMPWDHHGVPECLRKYLSSARAPNELPRKVLIPGCGAAYEVQHFVERGWQPLAIDFSPSAVDAARKQLGSLAYLVREGDFFGQDLGIGEFDAIYERAFLCALPRRLWADWASRVSQLLLPGATLIGFFYEDTNPKGPPFGLQTGELERLLSPALKQVEHRMPTDSIAIFAGKETWQVWERL